MGSPFSSEFPLSYASCNCFASISLTSREVPFPVASMLIEDSKHVFIVSAIPPNVVFIFSIWAVYGVKFPGGS